MPTFNYEGVDQSGRPKKGTLEAANPNEVKAALREKGVHPTSISQQGGGKGGKGGKKKAVAAAPPAERKRAFVIGGASQKELTQFTRQFATLVDAGLPMVRALTIMEDMLRPGALRNGVMDVHDEVEQGSSLSEAMAKSPSCFDELYVSMVRAGESSGLLGKILNRLAEFREKSQKLKKQIIGALIYPVAVLSVAGAILALIIMFIVPKFQEMFDGMGVDMPALTKFLMNLSDAMVNYWYLVPLIPISMVVIFVTAKATTPGRYFIDLVMLYLPVFGTIVKKSSVSRFCRTLGELQAAGVPLLEALNILRTAVGNRVVEAQVEDIHAAIREGESIADPMRRGGLFDMMVVNMVAVGEETGELDNMLIRIADGYDNDVDTLVSSMMSLLEPFLIIFMGGAVGFIVVALFMPLISIIEGIG